MWAGAWLCLLAPLAGFLAILLAGNRIGRTAAGWVEHRVGVRRLRGRCRRADPAVGRGARGAPPRADRVHLAQGRQLPAGALDHGRHALDRDDARRHGRRRPHRPLLDRLHGGRGRAAALLRLHEPLRLLDAHARAGRQPAADARRLGPRRPRLVPPDRLLPRAPRGGRRGEEGVHRQRARRRAVRDGALPADREDRQRRLRHRLRRGRERRVLVDRRRARSPSACSAAPSPSRRRSRSTPGCRTRWRGRRRSPPSSTRRRWSPPASTSSAAPTRSSRRRRRSSTSRRSSASSPCSSRV